MNAQRRKAINQQIDAVEALKPEIEKLHQAAQKIIERVDQINEAIGSLTDDENEAYDALPESLQGTDIADAMRDAISELESAASNLQFARDSFESLDLMETLDDVIASLDNAKGVE